MSRPIGVSRCESSWHGLRDDGVIVHADDEHHWSPCDVLGGALSIVVSVVPTTRLQRVLPARGGDGDARHG